LGSLKEAKVSDQLSYYYLVRQGSEVVPNVKQNETKYSVAWGGASYFEF
jgi:hypothetical protein